MYQVVNLLNRNVTLQVLQAVDVGAEPRFSNTDSVSHTFSSGVPSDDIIGNEVNTGMLVNQVILLNGYQKQSGKYPTSA